MKYNAKMSATMKNLPELDTADGADEIDPLDGIDAVDMVDETESVEDMFPTRVAAIVHADDFMTSIDSQTLAGRPYRQTQKEAALLFHQWLQSGFTRPDLRGRIVKPMGTGKTGLAIIMSEMVGGKVLFVADTNANGEQAAKEYEAHCATLPVENKKTVGRYFGPHEESKSDIVISGFWMQEKWMENIKWPEIRLLIIDEADINGLSKKRAEFIRKIAAEYGIPVIGMSATEEQMSGRELKDVFPDAIYRLPMPGSLPMCRKLRLIPHTNFHDVFFDGTLEIDRVVLRKKGDVEDSIIREFTKSNAWNKQVIEHYLQNGDSRQGLVVFRNNQQVDDFIAEAKQKGIRAMRFTGQEEVEELEKIREAFERGEVDLLVGSRLLGRGLNLPKIRVIYNSTLTYSPQIFWQVNGRALRNEEGDLLSHRDVYTVLPKSVKDVHTGASVYAEEMPLTNSAFFSRSFFPNESYLVGKKVEHLENVTFNIDKLPIIRAISEVMALVKGRRVKPEGFESKATQSAKLLSHLKETRMDIRICVMLHKMKSDRRIRIIQSLEDLDKDEPISDKVDNPLNILSNFPIELSMSEEMHLTQEMRKGIPLKSAGKAEKDIDPEVVKKAYHAREILLRAHLKLIAACAKMFVDDQFEYDDLFQEGIQAFLEALDDVVVGKGRIMNFGIYRLLRSLSRHIQDNNSQIRIPVHAQEEGKKLTRDQITERTRVLTWMLLQEDENLYVRFNEDKDQIWPSERILFADEEVTSHDASVESLKEDAVKKVLAGLSPAHEEILRLRFGLTEDGQTHTLEEIGDQFGVTRERIRQREAKAFRLLRGGKRADIIRPFWGDKSRGKEIERKPTLAEEINSGKK